MLLGMRNALLSGVAAAALSLPFSTMTPAEIATKGVTAERSGLAWQYDATGKITTCPNNLLLNSATLATQTVAISAGNYILSLMGTGSVAISGGATGTLAGTGVSTRVHLAFTATASSTFTVTVTGSVTSAQLEAVTYETSPRTYTATTSAAYYGPRLDYDPVTLAAKGLLGEEARTNLLIQSQDILTSWTATGLTTTANQAVAPDGTTTADLAVVNNGQSFVSVNASAATTVALSTYTASIFVKSAGETHLNIRLDSDNNKRAEFNLSSVTATAQVGLTSASIVDCGSGWYRCIITAPVTTTSTGYSLFPGTWGEVGNGTSGLYLWGAQLELGAFATSYIPTTTASVTRAADTQDLVTGAWYTPAAFSIVQDVEFLPGTYGALTSPTGTTVGLPIINSVPALRFDLAGTALVTTATTPTNGQRVKVAAAHVSGDQGVSVNGGAATTAAVVASAAASGTIRLGTNCWHRSFTAYNTRRSNADLATLATL